MRILVLALVAIASFCKSSHAEVIFTIQSVNIDQNLLGATTGSVDVFASATAPDLGQNWFGWQANVTKSGFTGSILASDIVFGTPANAVNFTQFMPLGSIGVESGNIGSAGGSAGTPIFNNAGLFSIPFTVAAGKAGSFNLSFVGNTSQVPTAYFTASGDFTPTFQGGTVTINAVPEPGSILLLGLGATITGLVARRRYSKAF